MSHTTYRIRSIHLAAAFITMLLFCHFTRPTEQSFKQLVHSYADVRGKGTGILSRVILSVARPLGIMVYEDYTIFTKVSLSVPHHTHQFLGLAGIWIPLPPPPYCPRKGCGTGVCLAPSACICLPSYSESNCKPISSFKPLWKHLTQLLPTSLRPSGEMIRGTTAGVLELLLLLILTSSIAYITYPDTRKFFNLKIGQSGQRYNWITILTSNFAFETTVEVIVNVVAFYQSAPISHEMVGDTGFIILWITASLCSSLATLLIGYIAGTGKRHFGSNGVGCLIAMQVLVGIKGAVPWQVVIAQVIVEMFVSKGRFEIGRIMAGLIVGSVWSLGVA